MLAWRRLWYNLITSAKAKEVMFSSLFVCLSVCLFVCLLATAQKLPNGFAWNFQWRLSMGQWTMVKFWWRSGSPSGYRDCFPDSSLLEDTENRINRLRCATLQCRACTSRRRHSNYDVITSPAHLAEVCIVSVLLGFVWNRQFSILLLFNAPRGLSKDSRFYVLCETAWVRGLKSSFDYLVTVSAVLTAAFVLMKFNFLNVRTIFPYARNIRMTRASL